VRAARQAMASPRFDRSSLGRRKGIRLAQFTHCDVLSCPFADPR
jgi:hypothetical protein